jgi:hypothetical protein
VSGVGCKDERRRAHVLDGHACAEPERPEPERNDDRAPPAAQDDTHATSCSAIVDNVGDLGARYHLADHLAEHRGLHAALRVRSLAERYGVAASLIQRRRS